MAKAQLDLLGGGHNDLTPEEMARAVVEEFPDDHESSEVAVLLNTVTRAKKARMEAEENLDDDSQPDAGDRKLRVFQAKLAREVIARASLLARVRVVYRRLKNVAASLRAKRNVH